jgi:outer membrane lipoprotein
MRQLAILVVFVGLFLTGCASSGCRTPVGDPSVTPSAVSATGSHLGESAQWGGVLVEARHVRDSTELEVVAYPLDDCGRPETGSGQSGRFIIIHPGFLETADFRTDQRISAAGRITGIRNGRVGDVGYRFPLLESYKVRLWPDRRAEGYYSQPWINIGFGGGSGGVFGGVGVIF